MKKKYRDFRANKLFRSFLFSYLLIAAVILAVLVLVTLYSFKKASDDIIDLQNNLLSERKKEIDLRLHNIEDISKMLSDESEIVRAGYFSDDVVEHRLAFSRLKAYFQNCDQLLQGEGSVYIYYTLSDSVLTLDYRYNHFNIDSFSYYHMSLHKDEFMDFLRNKSGYYILHSDTSNPQLILLSSIIDKENIRQVGKTIIHVSLPSMVRDILQNDIPEDSLFYITHESGNLCIQMDEEGVYRFSQFGLDDISSLSTGVVSLEGDRYYLTDTLSNHEGWHYKIAIPYTVFSQRARVYAAILAAGTVISLILSFFMAWHMARRFYTPAEKLLEALDLQQDDSYATTLSSAVNAVSEYRSQLTSKDRELRQYEIRKTQDAVLQLCEGRLSEKESQTAFSELGLSEKLAEAYRVVLFSFTDIQNSVFSSNGEADYNLVHFVLKNILSETLYDSLSDPLPIAFSDPQTCVLILPDEENDSLLSRISLTKSFLKDQIRLSSVVCISESGQHLNNIPEYYQQVSELLSHHTFWGSAEEDILFYENDSLDDVAVSLSKTDDQRKLYNLISVGNYPAAREELNTVLDNSFTKNLAFFPREKIRIYSLVSEITDRLRPDEENHSEDNDQVIKMMADISRYQTFSELKNAVLSLFDQLVREQEEREDQDESPAWIRSAKEYIEENYSDPSMNIAALADHYNLTPAHFSRSYKKYTNTGILDYINLIRVDHAKKLLDGGMSVHDAALAVGYTEARALIRYFKRYEGITPGQYQNQM